MRSREVIKRIEADGWYLVTVKGDHHHFKHPTKPGRVQNQGSHTAPSAGWQCPDRCSLTNSGRSWKRFCFSKTFTTSRICA
ncbi:type II toxin-antitoxin system HicA family toxin [Azotobacter armeniacus]